MKKSPATEGIITAADQARWADWDWTSPARFQQDYSDFLMAGYEESIGGKSGSGGAGGGCCIIS